MKLDSRTRFATLVGVVGAGLMVTAGAVPSYASPAVPDETVVEADASVGVAADGITLTSPEGGFEIALPSTQSDTEGA